MRHYTAATNKNTPKDAAGKYITFEVLPTGQPGVLNVTVARGLEVPSSPDLTMVLDGDEWEWAVYRGPAEGGTKQILLGHVPCREGGTRPMNRQLQEIALAATVQHYRAELEDILAGEIEYLTEYNVRPSTQHDHLAYLAWFTHPDRVWVG